MQKLCGFETLDRRSSPRCEVFTHKNWLISEYACDVRHCYRAGPNNREALVMGWLWHDNATTILLKEVSFAGGTFLSL